MTTRVIIALGGLLLFRVASATTTYEVSGCSGPQALAVAASAQSLVTDLEAARVQLVIVRQSVHQARQSLRTFGWTADREATLTSAEASLATAKQVLATAQAAYDEAFIESLTTIVGTDNALLAQRAMANAHRNVPDHYTVLELSEDGWKALESALAHEAEAAEDGQQPTLTDAEAAALSAAKSSAAVALAKQRIETNGPAIEAALGQYYKQQAEAPAE